MESRDLRGRDNCWHQSNCLRRVREQILKEAWGRIGLVPGKEQVYRYSCVNVGQRIWSWVRFVSLWVPDKEGRLVGIPESRQRGQWHRILASDHGTILSHTSLERRGIFKATYQLPSLWHIHCFVTSSPRMCVPLSLACVPVLHRWLPPGEKGLSLNWVRERDRKTEGLGGGKAGVGGLRGQLSRSLSCWKKVVEVQEPKTLILLVERTWSACRRHELETQLGTCSGSEQEWQLMKALSLLPN